MPDTTPQFFLIPYYNYIQDRYNISVENLQAIYDTMNKEGVTKLVFHGNPDGLSFEDFHMFVDTYDVCFVSLDGESIDGFFWLDTYTSVGNSGLDAHIHFCTFKTLRGKTAVQVARAILRQLLTLKAEDGKYVFAVLRGRTPTNNRLAVRFQRKVGMVLESEHADFVRGYITREQFNIE